MQALYPDWLIWWGAYSRRYWALPLWAAPRGTVVSAPEQDGLIAAMRAAWLVARTAWPGPAARGAGPGRTARR
jgi:hypothetical protein